VHPACVQAALVTLGQWKKEYEACQKCITAAQGMECETATAFFNNNCEVGKGGKSSITSEKMALTMQRMCMQLDKLDGIVEIKKAVEYLALQHDDMMIKNVELGKAMDKMNNTVHALKEQIKAKEGVIDTLMDRVNNLEQQALAKTIEIHGLQQNNPEDVRKVVVQLGETLGLQNVADSIDDVYRRRVGYGGRPPVVVMTLQTSAARNNWMQLRKKLRNENADKKSAIYINESLTYANRGLLKKVKEMGKEKQYKYIWTRDGQIFVRKNDTMGLVKILNETDAIRKIV
jgi:SMC interacting uncharacterized protein involved in chromosome segregation